MCCETLRTASYDSPGARTVLLVEDDRALRVILRRAFSESGFEFSEVDAGRGAQEVLLKELPDCVVLDLGLSDSLTGSIIERLEELDRIEEDSPVWIVTSALDLDEAVRQYGPLDKHYFPKPFDPWDLAKLLDEGLSRQMRPPDR